MKRHHRPVLGFITILAASLIAGRAVGRRVGEHAATAASPPPPPALATAPRAEPSLAGTSAAPPARLRSKEAMADFLKDLKTRLIQGAGGTSAVSAGFSDRRIAEELDGLNVAEVALGLDLISEWPPGIGRTGLSIALLSRWAREDPAGAAKYAGSHRDDAGPFGSLWLTAIFPQWAAKNPREAAEAFAATLKDEDDDIARGSLGNAVFMVADKLAEADAAAAFRHVEELPEWARSSARTAIARQVHGTRRQAFLDAIRAMPAGEARTEWHHQAAIAMAPVDASAANAWIDSPGLNPDEKEAANHAVFAQWKTHDPAAAAAWALGRMPASQRPAILAETVKTWAAREPNDCGRWLGQLTQGPEIDPALSAFATATAGKDPASAQAWAERITDEKLRVTTLRNIREQR